MFLRYNKGREGGYNMYDLSLSCSTAVLRRIMNVRRLKEHQMDASISFLFSHYYLGLDRFLQIISTEFDPEDRDALIFVRMRFSELWELVLDHADHTISKCVLYKPSPGAFKRAIRVRQSLKVKLLVSFLKEEPRIIDIDTFAVVLKRLRNEFYDDPRLIEKARVAVYD